jgi:hypothetical protein
MKFLIAILPVLLVSATTGSAFASEKMMAGTCQSSSLTSPSKGDIGERIEALQQCTEIQTEPQALRNLWLTVSNTSEPKIPDAAQLTPTDNIAPQMPDATMLRPVNNIAPKASKWSLLTDPNPPAEMPSPSLFNLDPSSAVQPRSL